MMASDANYASEMPSDSSGCGPILSLHRRELISLRQQIFEHIRACGQTARADIARALNISPGSVTSQTAELIAAGYLHEIDAPQRSESGRGRPSVSLALVADARHVIGIKIADERHSAVLTDFAGNILANVTLATTTTRKNMEQLLTAIDLLIQPLLEQTGLSMTDIAAVGIGVSGLVDHQTGIVAWSALMASTQLPLKSAFEARFGIPVYIDNDSNLLALAELWFGQGRAKSDFIVVTIEQGVGMGVVLNNQLYRGTGGMGMEFGHTKVQLDGALCRCGNRGCLEAYLADYAMAREASTALGYYSHSAKTAQSLLEMLYERAKEGNQSALTIFQRAGRYLALGLSNIIQLFDPELIILSGERMRYDYLYANEILDEMQANVSNQWRRPTKVEIHAWGDLVWARGASALALDAVTNQLMNEAR